MIFEALLKCSNGLCALP